MDRSQSFVCYVGSCHYSGSRTLRELISHMRLNHSHEKQCNLTCNIDGCVLVFNTGETYRRHVSIHHADKWNDVRRGWGKSSQELNDAVSINSDPNNACSDEAMNVETESAELSVSDKYNTLMNNISRDYFQLKLSLEYKYGMPEHAVKSLTLCVADAIKTFKSSYDDCIKSQIQSIGGTIDHELNFMLSDTISLDNCLVNFTERKEMMILEGMGYVEPQEVRISDEYGNVDILHYIPIDKTLKSYLAHEDVLESVLRENVSSSRLDKYCAGSSFHEHPIFSCNRSALRLTLYTDEFGVTNPIGAHKKRHKICGVYFSLNNIEAKHSSSLTSIHLALLAPYAAVKRHGYEKVFECIITDLQLLEEEGCSIICNGCVNHFKVGLVAVLGDNLSQHALGKFNSSFSSGRICRHCMALHNQIPLLLKEDQCMLRTVLGHNFHVSSVKDHPELAKIYGVKGECPFNKLTSFHPVCSLPPDIMHDVYEGLMPFNLSAVIRGLLKSKVLSLDEINTLLSNFKYGLTDKVNVHPGIPLNIKSLKVSLGGTAAEKCHLFYLFTLIIGPHVPHDNQYWHLHLLCNEICDILLSPVIMDDMPAILTALIEQHHKLWCSLPKDVIGGLKPKLHYLVHYPRMLEQFGPLRALSCMRFEAFHLNFKKFAKAANNFINVTHTLSTKFQRKRCLEFSGSNILRETDIKGSQRMCRLDSLSDLEREVLQGHMKHQNTEILVQVTSIHTSGQHFKTKEYVVVDVFEDSPVFFRIDRIFIDEEVDFFYGKLVYPYCFDRHLHAYEVQDIDDPNDFICVTPTQIVPLQHLSLYKISDLSFLKVRHTPVPVM